jgi:hypothetical protein
VATLLVAFDAAAFTGLLAAVPVVRAPLAGTDFDAAVLRSSAFLVVVLVAAFAIGQTLLMSYEPNSH